ncbi:MAG TPA: hypothetical protein VFX59_11055 [Polyangiales bacterium]|nr:hypothetical protein [Polyangiales bacterium]
MLSTLPYGDRSLALSMEGRDDKLKREHVLTFGERVGVRRVAVAQTIEGLRKHVAAAIPRLGEIGLETRRMQNLERVMRARLGDLDA